MFAKKNGNKTAKIRKDDEAGRSRDGGDGIVYIKEEIKVIYKKIKDVSRDNSWELLGAEDHAPVAPKSAKQLLNKDFHMQKQ